MQFVLEDFKKHFIDNTSPPVRRDSAKFRIGGYVWYAPLLLYSSV